MDVRVDPQSRLSAEELLLFEKQNCCFFYGVAEDSQMSLGQQGDQTSQS